MKQCVVYKIENIVNGRIYIGVTVDFNRRIGQHSRNPPIKMKSDIKKFSFQDFFTKEIIWEGSEEECYNKEIELISKFKPYYNTAEGGKRGWGNVNLSQKGEKCPVSKLTNKQVVKIRTSFKEEDITLEALAKRYNLKSRGTVYFIVKGETWKGIGGPILNVDYTKDYINKGGSKLSDKDIIDIRIKGYISTDSYREISIHYPLTKASIGNIIIGKTWKHIGGPIFKIDYMKRGEGSE